MSGALAHAAGEATAESTVRALLAGLGESPTFHAVPCGAVVPERALAGLEGDAFAFVSPDGRALVGGGLTRLAGPTPDDARRGLESLRTLALGPACALSPAAFFAAPFEAAPGGDEAFGLYLPTYGVRVGEGRAHVFVVGRRSEAARLEAPLRRLLDALARDVMAHKARVVEVEDEDDVRFVDSVRTALTAIESGRLRKVVLSRRVRARLDRPVEAAELLAALAGQKVAAVRFVRRAGGELFFGATPERLCAVHDGIVRTEALAGTSAVADARGLLGSEKDRDEQDAVSMEVRRRLVDLLGALREDAGPSVRILRDVAHLVTRFEGELPAGRDVFDVVATLHPTPAVAGVPTEDALRTIAELEPYRRRGYAAPLGIVDAEGDADVVVGLRSARLVGERLEAFAGAGVVRGSSAEAELRETSLKLRTVFSVFDGPST